MLFAPYMDVYFVIRPDFLIPKIHIFLGRKYRNFQTNISPAVSSKRQNADSNKCNNCLTGKK